MLLRDLSLPIATPDARGLALVFSATLAARLAQLHREFGSTNLVPVPSLLADGRYMLCADVLTEVQPGGLLSRPWQHADRAVLAASVEVISWADAVSMMPPPPPIDQEMQA